LITVGRIVASERYKGFDEIIELMPELIREITNLTYLIVGDGEDRERLERKAGALGLNGHVVFAGYVDEAEKADYYRLADAYVMPSRGEGFGFVLLEALACGIPVLGSKLDGTREALRDGALGILVDPGDRDELRRGILATLSAPRGNVPEGLAYFAYPEFENRCHRLLDGLLN
jgi:glycosyltransferase involved in cell wall biosynthesis